MSYSFVKLFSTLTDSTIWCEPSNIRVVWITMLSMADRLGRVHASIPGLANRARVPIEDVQIALTRFMSPDTYSRNQENEGRRIECLPEGGGWRLLNYTHYRELRDEDETRARNREAMRRKRASAKAARAVSLSGPLVTDDDA